MDALLLIGIQGSGKTTFFLERFFATHVRISRDLLRTKHREERFLATCLATRQPFVVDNTNVTRAERQRFIAPAKAARFRVIGYFFEPDPRAAFERNARRSGRARVPAAGLFGTLKRLQRPSLAEGLDELYRVRLAGRGEYHVESWAGEESPSGDAAG